MFGIGGHCDKGHGSGGAFGGAPWAQGGHKCPIGAALRTLNLTDEQLERLAELKGEGLAHCAQIKLGFVGLIKQVVRALLSEQIDKGKVKELFKQIQALKAQAGEEIPDRLIALAEVFTPEQRKKLRLQIIKHFLGVADCE